ncbi:MAG: hydroxymethylbilane synthase [Alphaproteobacteria bacterium]|nr:hydroxymethylbilane synthase [Alphaproteobacteria bacterium]
MSGPWRLGTRGSALARAQSEDVAARLRRVSGRDVELVVISTRGDRITDRPLPEVGGKGLFTLELEEGLRDGSLDLAVHSLKDLPSEPVPGLVIAAVPEREDPRDVLVGATLAGLPSGARVGTGSARRALQLRVARPDLVPVPIRGNVETRLRKQVDGEVDAVVLAAAGLARLGLSDRVTAYLDVDRCVPAVGQGALGVQCRASDGVLRAALAELVDPDAVDEVALERAFLEALGGGCSVPVACHAHVEGERLRVRAFVGRADGAWVSEAGVCDRGEARRVGRELAQRLTERLARQPPRAPDQPPEGRPA